MMNTVKNWRQLIRSYDERRNLIVPGDTFQTLQFCIDQFLAIGNEAIEKNGIFYVALSGGSTPKAIYQGLADPVHRNKIDWKRVHLFWSDERCVPPYDPESNYRMAMDARIESPACSSAEYSSYARRRRSGRRGVGL